MILPALLALLADQIVDLLPRVTKAIFIPVFLFLFLGNLHYFEIRFRYVLGQVSQQQYVKKVGSQ